MLSMVERFYEEARSRVENLCAVEVFGVREKADELTSEVEQKI